VPALLDPLKKYTIDIKENTHYNTHVMCIIGGEVYMNTMRFNITVDKDIGLKLRHIHNKSKFISEALREKINHQEIDKKRETLRNAYIASSKEDHALASDWDATVGDTL
jgi:hypothetical protein